MLGMGTFGTALAVQLSRNGCRVTGVDSQRERRGPLQEVGHAVPPMMRASLHAELAAAVRRAALQPAAAPAP